MSHSFLNLLLSIHFLVVAAALLSFLLRALSYRRLINISARNEMCLNYILVLLIFILPILVNVSSKPFRMDPVVKTINATTYREFDSQKFSIVGEKILLGAKRTSPSVSINNIENLFLLLIFLSLAVSLFKVSKEIKKIRIIIDGANLFRSIGKVKIAFSDSVTIPISMRSLNTAWVLMPSCFLTDAGKTKMAILHELQHHRQGDTLWLYVFLIMKTLIGVNPACLLWQNLMFEVQELKVDERLVDQGKVKSGEYARCLIEVAETFAMERERLVCATGLGFFPDRQQLTRRIQEMFKRKTSNRGAALIIGALIISSMSAMALSASELIGSRSVTMAEAQEMATVAKKDSNFPIVVNDLVLEQLNRYLGTSQGREFMKNSLVRMEQYRPLIERKIKSFPYPVPIELMAVPLIESGYLNSPESRNRFKAAGLWQFIRSTARIYGLQIDDNVDQRQDVELATDAAIRYIVSNQLRFKDWLLSVQAYNMGEGALQKAIDKMGTKDVWRLIEAGYEGDKSYLAKLQAAILIMKNPDILN